MKLFKNIKSAIYDSMPVEKIVSTTIGKRYVTDIPFRGGINIYQGLSINLIYATVHVINGIISRSAWFISLVLYYLILGLLRVYLAYKLSQGNHRQGCLILSNSYDRHSQKKVTTTANS